jgi:hypothetical protein
MDRLAAQVGAGQCSGKGARTKKRRLAGRANRAFEVELRRALTGDDDSDQRRTRKYGTDQSS